MSLESATSLKEIRKPTGFEVESFQTVSLTEARNELVANFLDQGAFSSIYGAPKSGKTYVSLDMEFSIARGVDWFRNPTQKGLVLHIAAEGAHSVRKRIIAYRQFHGLESKNLPFALLPKKLDLFSNSKDADKIIETVKHLEDQWGEPCRLIVGDTLNRLISTGKENSEDMNILIHNVDRVREKTSAHFCLIHHTGKDATKGLRGHTSLLGSVDQTILVSKSRVQLIEHRDKDVQAVKPIDFRLETIRIGETADGTPLNSCVVVPAVLTITPDQKLNERSQQALERLRELEPTPHGRVAREAWLKNFNEVHMADASLHRSTRSMAFRRACEQLCSQGYVSHADGFYWRTP